MRTRIQGLVLGGLLLVPAGCGTVVSAFDGGPRVYSGVRLDAYAAATIFGSKGQPKWWVYPFAVLGLLVDFPLSAAADTVLLPYTLLVDPAGAATGAATGDAAGKQGP